MSDISISIGADGSKAISEYQKLQRELDDLKKEIDKVTKASVDSSRAQVEGHQQNLREMKKLEASAGRVIKEIQTPTEQYRQAVADLKRMHDAGKLSLDQYNRALEIQSNKMLLATKATHGFSGVQSRLAGVATGFLSIGAAVASTVSGLQEAQREADQAALALDRVQRGFRVTSELRGLQAAKSQDSINKVAIEAGMPVEQVTTAATQLVSSGFSAEEASGPALKSLVRTMGSMAAVGKNVDIEELAKGFVGYLESQGMAKTGANMDRLGTMMFGLRAGNMTMEAFPALAKEGAAMRAISPEEQLAGFTTLLDAGMAPESAAVAERNLVVRLQTAGSEKAKIKALKEMGLKPEEIDLTGEKFPEAIATLQAGLQRLPEERRPIALKQIVETEGMAAFNLLAGNQDKMAEYIQLQGDPKGREEAIREAQSGPNAAKIRLENEKQVILAEKSIGLESRVDALRIAQERNGMSGGSGGWSRWAYEKVAGATGNPRLGAAAATFTGILTNRGLDAAKVYRTVEEGEAIYQKASNPTKPGANFSNPNENARLAEATERNNQLLEEQNAMMRQQQNKPAPVEVVNQPKATPRPAGPRPSQARSR